MLLEERQTAVLAAIGGSVWETSAANMDSSMGAEEDGEAREEAWRVEVHEVLRALANVAVDDGCVHSFSICDVPD